MQSKLLQNDADFEQALPFDANVLHVDNTPVYTVQAVEGSTHPAPLVTQPVKNVLHSALDFRVFAA